MSSEWGRSAARAFALLKFGPIRLGPDGRWRFGASVVGRRAVQAVLDAGLAERDGATVRLSASLPSPEGSHAERRRNRALRGWATRQRNRQAAMAE